MYGTYANENPLPKLDSATEHWMTVEAHISTRSRGQLDRNLKIYKSITQEKKTVSEVAQAFGLSCEHTRHIISRVRDGIESRLKRAF